jgi:hypothetical protein
MRHKQSSACCVVHGGIFRGVLFNPEDGDDVFLQNSGSLSLGYMALYRGRQIRGTRLPWHLNFQIQIHGFLACIFKKIYDGS